MKPLFLALPLAAVLAACTAGPQQSPYARQQERTIKALSPTEVDGYLEGRGLGFARPAELNGYPGPMHVLELADALKLTPAQRSATQALFAAHKAEARELGRRYIDAERSLDQLFAARAATPDSLKVALAQATELQGRIRESHLETHLRQTALLTPQQVAEYGKLRGYGSAHGAGHSHH